MKLTTALCLALAVALVAGKAVSSERHRHHNKHTTQSQTQKPARHEAIEAAAGEEQDLEMGRAQRVLDSKTYMAATDASVGGLIGALSAGVAAKIGNKEAGDVAKMGGIGAGLGGLLGWGLGTGQKRLNQAIGEAFKDHNDMYGQCASKFSEYVADCPALKEKGQQVVEAFAEVQSEAMKTAMLAFPPGLARKAMLFSGLGASDVNDGRPNKIMQRAILRSKATLSYICNMHNPDHPCVRAGIEEIAVPAKIGRDADCPFKVATGATDPELGLSNRWAQLVESFDEVTNDKLIENPFRGGSRFVGAAIAVCIRVAGQGKQNLDDAEFEMTNANEVEVMLNVYKDSIKKLRASLDVAQSFYSSLLREVSRNPSAMTRDLELVIGSRSKVVFDHIELGTSEAHDIRDIEVPFTWPVGELNPTQRRELASVLTEFALKKRKKDEGKLDAYDSLGRKEVRPDHNGRANRYVFRLEYHGIRLYQIFYKQLTTNPRDLKKALRSNRILRDFADTKFEWGSYVTRTYRGVDVSLNVNEDMRNVYAHLADFYEDLVERVHPMSEEDMVYSMQNTHASSWDDFAKLRFDDRDDMVTIHKASLELMEENSDYEEAAIAVELCGRGYGTENMFVMIDLLAHSEPTAENAQFIHDKFAETFNLPHVDHMRLKRLVGGWKVVSKEEQETINKLSKLDKENYPLGLADVNNEEENYYNSDFAASFMSGLTTGLPSTGVFRTWHDEFEDIVASMRKISAKLVRTVVNDVKSSKFYGVEYGFGEL